MKNCMGNRNLLYKRMTNYEVIVLSDRDPQTSACFPCFKCNRCMAGKEFFLKDGHKYCAECFGQTFGLKCASCQKTIQGMSRVNFIFYDNRIWHERCFKCSNCGKVFNEKGQPKSGEYLNCTRCGAH